MRVLLALLLIAAPVSAEEYGVGRRQLWETPRTRGIQRESMVGPLPAQTGRFSTMPQPTRVERPSVRVTGGNRPGRLCGRIAVGDSVVRLSC